MTSEDIGGYVAYAASALKDGREAAGVRADLVARGLSEEDADAVLRTARDFSRRRRRRAGALYLAIGLVCLALGTVITWATYSAAQAAGGIYVVTIGLFGFGVGYTVGGLVHLARSALAE